jgi:peptide subunit release factor 1 (eRF1)
MCCIRTLFKKLALLCVSFAAIFNKGEIKIVLSFLYSQLIAIVSCFTVPTNGLVVYCGTVMTDEGKEKKVNIDFEPFRPINTSLYLCDNKFHTEVCKRIRRT